jgi:hypothetical protein
MSLPDELRGGRGGRVAPGFGPTGGPVRGGAGRVGTTAPVAAAAAARAASRSIEGVEGRGGSAVATSGAGVLVDAAAVRCVEMTLVTAGGRVATGDGAGSVAGVADARGTAGSSWWSGETGRRRPSASALRRTRSAWASSMDEEWLFTPMPREMERSRASLLVRPSSLASS